MPADPPAYELVRSRCAEVADRATLVGIDSDRLAALATTLLDEGALDTGPSAGPDPWSVDPGDGDGGGADAEAAVALVVVLDAVNFGSGWHPVVRKRPGCSGATTMAAAVRDWAAAEGTLRADRLATVTVDEVCTRFDQPGDGPAAELMALFTAALTDLGRLVVDRFDSRFGALVAAADGSADALIEGLLALPAYRDVATHHGVEVPLLKRAQITVADLHRSFGGTGPGVFDDVDRLTAFADNLVPHVLRVDGVLRYDPELASTIDAGTVLPAGSTAEVEIRALGVHAVELLAEELAQRGRPVPPRILDTVLWRRGGAARYKAVPRHRTRCTFY